MPKNKILFFRTTHVLMMLTKQTTLSTHQQSLINICDVIPTIHLDIRYATTNNFTGKQVYPDCALHSCFLHEAAAQALKKVQEELQLKSLSLKIFDGYRPQNIQKIFWNLIPDPRYVADPKKGSRHNRGCAVDVTLVSLNGTELPMPTKFDDFTECAHADFPHVSTEVAANRKLLQTVMTQHGFEVMPTEWWHFDFKDWRDYPVLDISFEKLLKNK
jgi:D-alanyl-D-alanine dipeptidase